MLVCQRFEEEDRLASLVPAWRQLQAEHGLVPFTDYAWVEAWWRTIGRPSGAALMVMACFDEGALVGVLPFTIRRKAGGTRVLHLVGHEAFFYAAFLVRDQDVCACLWQAALTQPVYDFADIKNVQEQTGGRTALEACALWQRESHVYVHRFASRERAVLEKSVSKTVRRKLQGLTKQDAVFSSQCEETSPSPDALAFLLARKKAWTQERGKRGVFQEQGLEPFYREMVRLAEAQGQLAFFCLRQDGRPVAALLGLVSKGTFYLHTQTFDPCVARLSPGLALAFEALAWAAEKGLRDINFMEGEEPYKKLFAKESVPFHSYFLARTWKGRVYALVYRSLMRARRVRAGRKKTP